MLKASRNKCDSVIIGMSDASQWCTYLVVREFQFCQTTHTVSEWVEFNALPDTVLVISEAAPNTENDLFLN